MFFSVILVLLCFVFLSWFLWKEFEIMHRKSLPVCVFLILTSMVSFLGCSFSASGSPAQAKDSAVTEGGQAAGADMLKMTVPTLMSAVPRTWILKPPGQFLRSPATVQRAKAPKVTLPPARSAPLSRNVWFLRLPAHWLMETIPFPLTHPTLPKDMWWYVIREAPRR